MFQIRICRDVFKCKMQSAKRKIKELRCDYKCLPLTREVAKRSFDGGRDRFINDLISPSVCFADSSLVRGSRK